MNRISLKQLAKLGGRIPRSTIVPKRENKPPVRQARDPRNQRGYREIVNAAEMQRRLKDKVKEQRGLCGICWNPLPDELERIAPDHIEPKGMGGATHDSHPDNLQAAHPRCNLKKGSRRVQDRLLLIGPYFLYVEGLECFCGRTKQKNRPTCLECWPRLPGQLQHDLNTLKKLEHAKALVEAKRALAGSDPGPGTTEAKL